MDLLVGRAARAHLELLHAIAGEAGMRVAIDQTRHGDHALGIDDDRAVIEVEPLADLVAVADRDDLAGVRGDPHVTVVHLDLSEVGAAQGLALSPPGVTIWVRRQMTRSAVMLSGMLIGRVA